jgi:hypothetical protein
VLDASLNDVVSFPWDTYCTSAVGTRHKIE